MKKIILILVVLLYARNIHAGEVVVIVNETGPLSGITTTEIRDIYLGHIRFLKGVKIVPVNYREGPVKDAFLKAMLGKTSREYRLYWTKKSFKEGITAPGSQRNYKQIISTVKRTVGAIGYLPVSELGDTDGVKIIFTIKDQATAQ